MISTNLTHLFVSPTISRNGTKGHEIKVAFELDLDQGFLNSEIARYFDFVAEVTVRLEWKKHDGGTTYILNERERIFRPMKRYLLAAGETYAADCFLDAEFLRIQPGYPEAAEIHCRVSMMPVLGTTSQNLSYERDGNRYVLHTVNDGQSVTYLNAVQGREY